MKLKIETTKKEKHFLHALLYGFFIMFIRCNPSNKLVSPHGDKCGCKKTKDYSPALGCPNPKSILHVK